jgi:CelD/BcsL family acetyltransferase involved in cellulose biosynthesis
MEGNKMSTEEVVVGHQEGPAWEIVAKCATYDEADQKRLELAMEEDLQVKVHWQGKVNHRYYAVKTREDPSIALAAALNAKREEKKKRKAKLNKKRRKK